MSLLSQGQQKVTLLGPQCLVRTQVPQELQPRAELGDTRRPYAPPPQELCHLKKTCGCPSAPTMFFLCSPENKLIALESWHLKEGPVSS
jgi:hypothetical protein